MNWNADRRCHELAGASVCSRCRFDGHVRQHMSKKYARKCHARKVGTTLFRSRVLQQRNDRMRRALKQYSARAGCPQPQRRAGSRLARERVDGSAESARADAPLWTKPRGARFRSRVLFFLRSGNAADTPLHLLPSRPLRVRPQFDSTCSVAGTAAVTVCGDARKRTIARGHLLANDPVSATWRRGTNEE